MATTSVSGLIRHLRQVFLRQDGAGSTDSELMALYVNRREDAAFEALVHRHGPMVLGVCRRILRNEADAEDAFQATFLVLVRKAASLRSWDTVSNWLYGVAQKTALKAKAMNFKQRLKERETKRESNDDARAEAWQELQALLDAELSRLPDKYRIPIVLCHLEGKTIKEAAHHLGWPPGTMATRLARGRAQLAKRLTRQGLTLSGGVMAVVMSQAAVSAQGMTSACVPASLVVSTVRAATAVAGGHAAAMGLISTKVVALTERVIRAMLMTKLKTLAVLVLAAVVPAGGGALLSSAAWVPSLGQQVSSSASSSDDQKAREGKADEDEAKEAESKEAKAKAEVKRAEALEAKAKAVAKEAEAQEAKAKAEAKAAEAKAAKEAEAKAAKAEAEAKEAEAKKAKEAEDKEAASDKKAILGTWVAVSGEQNGQKIPKEKLEAIKLIFTEDKVAREGYEPKEGTYTIDQEKKPKEIDLFANANPWKGIYELNGKTLKLVCKRNDRPTEFDSNGGRFLLVLEKK
jgi:RNA polymerase sigma factor (sigma-70 family)